MADRLDTELRELTYRLMHMAPEAPPFPAEAPVRLPEPSRVLPRSWRTRPPAVLWFAAAALLVLVLVGLPLLLFSGGGPAPVGTSRPATPTTTTGVTTTPPATTAPVATTPTTTVAPAPPVGATVHLLVDDGAGSVKLMPFHRLIDGGDEVASLVAALASGASEDDLAVDPSATTAVPRGTVVLGSSRDGSNLTVDLSRDFESGSGLLTMQARLAQLTFTLTGLDGVDAVAIHIEGEPAQLFSSEGIVLDGPLTRLDHVDLIPLVYLDEPPVAASVSSPVVLTGLANAFEATVLYEIVAEDGSVLAEGFTTATCGTGCWGEFEVVVEVTLAEETTATVTVFTESAEDGSRRDEVSHSVRLIP